MSESSGQIFISYARDDDLPTPHLPDSVGIVTALHKQLEFSFAKLGYPRPTIWRDINKIDEGDLFNPLISDGIDGSSMLLVILSRNWIRRPYCLKELDLFRDRWSRGGQGDFGAEHRITVAQLNEVEERPELLQGQTGYKFYNFIGRHDAGYESLLFDRGKPQDGEYFTRCDRLASHLWTRAKHILRKEASAPNGNGGIPPVVDPATPKAPQNARSVYLATPASDMRQSYQRMVKELTGWGYRVVPDPETDIPDDAAAAKLFDDALAGADVAIHLLGNKRGFTLDSDPPEAIVPLQLNLARQRCVASDNSDAIVKFRRIIWAPKILAATNGDDEAAQMREPAAVLDEFDQRYTSDSVIGDSLSKFVDFLGPHLDRSLRAAGTFDPPEAGATIYLSHRPEDEQYAINLAKLLKKRNVRPVLRATQGQSDELIKFHRDRLRLCDSVIVCWAATSEVAARVMWEELEDWRAIGRTRQFARRGLIAGPPPSSLKRNVDVLFPTKQVDFIADLTSHDPPVIEDLNPLFGGD